VLLPLGFASSSCWLCPPATAHPRRRRASCPGITRDVRSTRSGVSRPTDPCRLGRRTARWTRARTRMVRRQE